MSVANIFQTPVTAGLQAGIPIGATTVALIFVFAFAVLTVAFGFLWRQTRGKLKNVNEDLEEVIDELEISEQKSFSSAVGRSSLLKVKVRQNELKTASEQTSTTVPQKKGDTSTLATILDNPEDEHFVSYPKNTKAQNLHRQLKRSLTSSNQDKAVLANQLKTAYSQITSFDEVDNLLQELAANLPEEVNTADELEQVRDKTRQTKSEVDSTEYGDSLGPILSWFANKVDDYAKLHREYTTQQQRVKQIHDRLYPDQAAESVLSQLLVDIRANRISNPTAYQAANDYDRDNIRSPTARDLVTTLADSEASKNEVTAALDNTVNDLNQYTTLQGRLSSTSTAGELQSRVDEALVTCEEIEGHIGNVIAKRLRDDRERLDDDPSLLYRRGAEARVTVLKDVLNDFVGRNTGEVTDVEERRRQVAKELDSYRDDYFASNQYDQYSTTIPNHFANLVETLLSKAAQAIQNGDRERGSGLTTAAELTLDRIKSMYGSRQIQRQLTDLQKIRSPQYRLVSTD